MGRIVLVCGMPGAGKTTLARRLVEDHDGVALCPDDWLLAMGLDPHDPRLRRDLERAQWSHAVRLAELGLTVVVDFGLWSRVQRRRMRDRAREVGATVELHALDVSLAERWRRIERRNGEPGAVVITRDQLEDYQRWWQPPTAEELAAYDPPVRRSGGATSGPNPVP